MGRETLCAGLNNHRGGMIGAHRDGGYAEFVAVPARNLVNLPDEISFEQACLIPNTIGPVVKACAGRARIRPGEWVLILGAGGGMGIHAVQAAHACGGRVIASIRSRHREQAVRDAGAEIVLSLPAGDLAPAVRQITTDDGGVDAALDFVAHRDTLRACVESLAPGARLVIMGYFPRGGVFETPTWPFTEEIEVTGNRSAGRQDIAQTIALIRSGRIRPMVARVFRLDQAVEAHRAFEAGELVGRAVIVV
jgi:propanol-preferring alcohol dehydrogenase